MQTPAILVQTGSQMCRLDRRIQCLVIMLLSSLLLLSYWSRYMQVDNIPGPMTLNDKPGLLNMIIQLAAPNAGITSAMTTATTTMTTATTTMNPINPDLVLQGKDVCQVWKSLRSGATVGTIMSDPWWSKLCYMESVLDHLTYQCKTRQVIHGKGVYFDENVFPKNNCIVYSFGINNEFQFDDAMAAQGCTVFAFDPSMGVADHKHAEKVFFKNTGLSNVDQDNYQPFKDGYVIKNPVPWRMRTMGSIMKELGHTKGSVTILKMDIEHYEWDVMENILAMEGLMATIPQVMIEWHIFYDRPPRARYDAMISTLSRMKDTGFLLFSSWSEGQNHDINGLKTQRETSWINSRFLKPSS